MNYTQTPDETKKTRLMLNLLKSPIHQTHSNYCHNYTNIKVKLNILEHLHETLRPDQDCINKIIKFLKFYNLYNLN